MPSFCIIKSVLHNLANTHMPKIWEEKKSNDFLRNYLQREDNDRLTMVAFKPLSDR